MSAVALAGCGGESRMSAAEYRKAAQPIADRYQRTWLFEGYDAVHPDENDDMASGLKAMRSRAAESASQLSELSPPENVQKEHDELVKYLGDVEDGAKTALDPSVSDQEFKAALQKYATGTAGVQITGEAIKRKVGVDFNRPMPMPSE
jgi:hypothetical protein